jgi:hypothetical protein
MGSPGSKCIAKNIIKDIAKRITNVRINLRIINVVITNCPRLVYSKNRVELVWLNSIVSLAPTVDKRNGKRFTELSLSFM